MLNELWQVARGLEGAGIPVATRHPDIKEVSARGGVLRVRLDGEGRVRQVAQADAAGLWTLRDGQHNSFPYQQFKDPLLLVDPRDPRLKVVRDRKAGEEARWNAFRDLATTTPFNADAASKWPGAGLLRRLQERRAQLEPLREGKSAAALGVIERFLLASNDPSGLLKGVADALIAELDSGTSMDFPLFVSALLEGGAPLYFDVTRDFPRLVGDERNMGPVSEALSGSVRSGQRGACALAGQETDLEDDKFPQPNLPILGQTFLFAKNRDAPCNARYGHEGPEGIPIGRATAATLQGAVTSLTRAEWKNATWRGVPAELPKETDLLLAFVPELPGAPVAAALSGDPDPEALDSFSERARLLAEAFEGKRLDRKDARVQLTVLRKLDPANRKVVYSGTPSVGSLLNAAEQWETACRNAPPVQLPVPGADGKLAPRSPGSIAPLDLVRITRRQFMRGGREHQDMVGATASEVLRLFLATHEEAGPPARAMLRRILHNRAVLVREVAHARPRGLDSLKRLDRREALTTITILGLLLHKLDRTRERYMEDTAYRLGQLLAAADALHAGYNASERNGDMPPTLIGNAVFVMAQGDPTRALSVLARRWSVYHAWAGRAKADQHRLDSDKPAVQQKEWTKLKGILASRRARELAASLTGTLPRHTDDIFRAELLLGYIAGPPRGDDATKSQESTPAQTTGE